MSKIIDFKIVYAKNEDIYQMGYVEVPDDEEEEVEWFYYDQNGFVTPRMFTHHNGIGLTQIGATDEQLAEIDEFKKQFYEFIDFITDVIVQSDEDESISYYVGDLFITVGDD